ncbi:MAG: hypothetical protein Q4E84_07805, partial [Clostridia bacterium]|nr:hypothetical protein [Clostridia bacterium]
MKIVKIIFIVVGVLFIGGFCFMNLYSTEVASLDEIQIENISDDSENKICQGILKMSRKFLNISTGF